LASLLKRGLAHRVVEAASPVAHVEDHTTLLRRFGRGNELSVLNDVVARPAEGVRQDISWSKEVEEVRYGAGGVADVAHHAKLRAGHARGPNGSPFCPTTDSVIRTLTPSVTSAFCATAL